MMVGVRNQESGIRKFISSVFCLLVSCFLVPDSTALEFHTPPQKWQKPRVVHSPLDEEYTKRFEKDIQISYVKPRKDIMAVEKTYSLNESYWFVVRDVKNCKAGVCPADIYIHNDHNNLINIHINKLVDGLAVIVEWINEKLIYIEPWWNPLQGVYFIYDVEQEKIIARELVYNGEKLFEQAHADDPKTP